jgi:hypothetical protein
MKYQIQGTAWPVGDVLIPTGVVIDAREGTDHASLIARGKVPPPSSLALDQEAYDVLRKTYPFHQIFAASGVRR